MKGKIIVFGDLHLDWEALRVILKKARELGINTAINLGDEDSLVGGQEWQYEAIFGSLRDYVNEQAERKLYCCYGDKTGGVPRYLRKYYVGYQGDDEGLDGVILREANIIAGHEGTWILNEYKDYIESYKETVPLVVFHGHSHSMGVLPEFKWLQQNELVHFIKEGQRELQLESGNVYWANPGTSVWGCGNEGIANFLVYDPKLQNITLMSEPFTRTREPPVELKH